MGASSLDPAFAERRPRNDGRLLGAKRALKQQQVWAIRAPSFRNNGTHSLKRTKVSIIYKATGNLRPVQLLLGHAKIESTVRYLGVDIEVVLQLAERTEV